ncbi:hypothetical protein ABT117_35800 [Streptomyces sp. NPDC002262]|uniref:hypothetical protein n=1 Tax=Streptomyces sp. NPDC002262 TaxID=3154414 RepID=UPI0033336220
MGTGEDQDALVLEAREMLAAGRSDEEVFAELATRTGNRGVCVVAVCLALGVPRPDAEARLREAEPLFPDFAIGEEEDLAFVLGFGNVFTVDRVLEEHEERIRDFLRTAAGARGGSPGSLFTWFRTGELTKVFLYFAETRFRDGRGSPPEFWAAMTAAGELLAGQDGPDRAKVTAGLERCRTQAAAFSAKQHRRHRRTSSAG